MTKLSWRTCGQVVTDPCDLLRGVYQPRRRVVTGCGLLHGGVDALGLLW